jgi:hypothetical protein
MVGAVCGEPSPGVRLAPRRRRQSVSVGNGPGSQRQLLDMRGVSSSGEGCRAGQSQSEMIWRHQSNGLPRGEISKRRQRPPNGSGQWRICRSRRERRSGKRARRPRRGSGDLKSDDHPLRSLNGVVRIRELLYVRESTIVLSGRALVIWVSLANCCLPRRLGGNARIREPRTARRLRT